MEIKDYIFSNQKRDDKLSHTLALQVIENNDKEYLQRVINEYISFTLCQQYKALRLMYHIGCEKPNYLAPYTLFFIELLDHRNPSIQSVCMMVLHTLVEEEHNVLFEQFEVLHYAGTIGSVVSRDYLLKIAVSLAKNEKYYTSIIPLLLECLEQAPENQMATYAEWTFGILQLQDVPAFEKIIAQRILHTKAATKLKRLESLIQKIHQQYV